MIPPRQRVLSLQRSSLDRRGFPWCCLSWVQPRFYPGHNPVPTVLWPPRRKCGICYPREPSPPRGEPKVPTRVVYGGYAMLLFRAGGGLLARGTPGEIAEYLRANHLNRGTLPPVASDSSHLRLAGGDAPITLRERLDGWDADMAGRLGFGDVHRKKSRRAVERLLDETGWSDPGQIDAGRVVETLNRYIEGGGPGARSTARKLTDQYRCFGAYLKLAVPLAVNPFENVTLPRPRKRRKRAGARAFTWDEACRIIASAQRGEVAHWQGRRYGPSRSTFYTFLLYTGLRFTEARRQRWEDVNLDEGWMILTADKSDRNDRIPIAADLLATFRTWRGYSRGAMIFPIAVSHHTLVADLKAAGVAGKGDGKDGQWHRWRKTLGTQCGRSGVNPAVAHKILRHSDASLTLGEYTDLELSELREGMKSLPSVKNYACPPAPTEVLSVGLQAGHEMPKHPSQHGSLSAAPRAVREPEDLADAGRGGAPRIVAGRFIENGAGGNRGPGSGEGVPVSQPDDTRLRLETLADLARSLGNLIPGRGE